MEEKLNLVQQVVDEEERADKQINIPKPPRPPFYDYDKLINALNEVAKQTQNLASVLQNKRSGAVPM